MLSELFCLYDGVQILGKVDRGIHEMSPKLDLDKIESPKID